MKALKELDANERKAVERALQELTARFSAEIRFIALFGSKSRGDFGPDSDVDLLIVREGDDWQSRDRIRSPIFDANIDYTTMLSPWVIGWERFQRIAYLQPGLLANLQRDAIELWRRPGTENPLQLPELTLAA